MFLTAAEEIFERKRKHKGVYGKFMCFNLRPKLVILKKNLGFNQGPNFFISEKTDSRICKKRRPFLGQPCYVDTRAP